MDNKVVLITGASGGIGKALATTFAKNNYDVIIHYNGSKDKAMQVLAECKQYGSQAMVIQANISDAKEVETMVKEVFDTYGRIDVLINNSGITKDTLMLRMSEEDFEQVIDVNLNGSFYTTKHVSRIMLKQRSGSIINMASVIGQVGNIGQVNYAASKAGLIGLTKSCAKEFASRGVRVNAIAPGFIETDMTRVLDEKVVQEILKNIPLQKLGQTEDVANMALFLASDSCSYVTGQVFNVDGGMVM